MIVIKNTHKIIVVICALFFGLTSQAQLGFCTGNSGDPIFIETFDVGNGFGDLPIESNSGYRNVYGKPENGSYAISSSTYGWFDWFNIADHTEGDSDGRMLIINAASRPGEFFEIQVSGLCENTSYEFSSWLINLLPSSFSCRRKVPINVRFEIWDSTDSFKIKSGDTGNIYSSSRPNWQQYGLVFQTKPGQTSVILKMRNNGVGGCGNDLAIDDIMFRTCGDSVVIEDTVNNMRNAVVDIIDLPYSATLKASPDFSVFSTHFYHWQKSEDGTNWQNIPGATNNSFLIKDIEKTTYFRVLVAEDQINLLNALCNSSSEVFKVNVVSTGKTKKVKKKVIIPKKRKKVKTLSKSIEGISIAGLNKVDKPLIRFEMISPKNLIKTRKRVIVVMDGVKISNDKVWIDGVKGKYVQTSEEIIKQGEVGADIIIEETKYVKARYGYNSTQSVYIVKGSGVFILR